jgi:hypothetical protein
MNRFLVIGLILLTRTTDMRSSAVVLLAIACTGVIPGDRSPALAAESRPQGALDAPLREFADLLVTLGEQAVRQSRLASPLPCAAHWVASGEHVIVAVSRAGAGAGLERSDTLRRIGGRDLARPGDAPWASAMRALSPSQPSYAVEIDRKGTRLRLVLPCAADDAGRLHRADLAMWTAVTRRDWPACLEHGAEMIAAFGTPTSPPLMVMTQCATASGKPDASLTATLARALLAEMAAHPGPQPDLRAQVRLALRQLEAIHAAGGEDHATGLRIEMAKAGLEP